MDSYISNKDGGRISPSTEDKQRDIETLLQILAGDRSLMVNSTVIDTQKLTIASNLARGLDQPCRTCLLSAPSGNTGRIYITTADRDANDSDWLVPEDMAVPYPVTNLSKIRIYGGTNGDVLYITWRN